MMFRLLLLALLLAGPASAGESWIVRTDLWGNPAFATLTLESRSGTVSGTLDGDGVTGTADAKTMNFTATDSSGAVTRYRATISGDRMAGRVDAPDTNNPAARAMHDFRAWRVPPRPAGGPRRLAFQPADFSNRWDADRAPVLLLWSGDSVATSTIDSGGVDAAGQTRALFGNPQTGPFFIVGAEPGDTLAVRLLRLTPNRDHADSLDSIVDRALGPRLAAGATTLGKPIRWQIDRAAGIARPIGASGALGGLKLPLRPMLGGLGVAPGFGTPALSTGDTGRFGGNMDWNEVVAGNIVYLPVQQPGALLYLGDAHAAQGDGETSQYGLETSMDVVFAVDLVKGQAIAMPRVESANEIMVLGQAGSLDEALKAATSGMIDWLARDYGLTLAQSGQLLGAAVRYHVVNLAGRSVGIAARIDKALLPRAGGVVSVPLEPVPPIP